MAIGQFIFKTNGFGRLLALGSYRTLNYAKTMLGNPALIGGAVGFLNIEATSCQISGDAEVSTNLIVGSQGKQYITDNIAPGPWSWNITGYIPGNNEIDVSAYFQPTLKFNIARLMQTYKKGDILTFKDCNCVPFQNCVIKQLTIDTVPDAQNRAPLTMVIQQIETLTANEEYLYNLESSATSAPGSVDGSTQPLGAVQTTYTSKLKSGKNTIQNFFEKAN